MELYKKVLITGAVLMGLAGATYLMNDEKKAAPTTGICDYMDDDCGPHDSNLGAIAYVACKVPGMESNYVCQEIKEEEEFWSEIPDYSGSMLLIED